MDNGTPIILCKNFTYLAGAAAAELLFDWIGIDPSYKSGDLVIDVKVVDPAAAGPLTVSLDTSMDTTLESSIGSTNVNAFGRTITQITSGLLQMIRLSLASNAVTRMIISVWFLPKHD